MKIEEFKAHVKTYGFKPKDCPLLYYLAIGLAEEAGESAGCVKKLIRVRSGGFNRKSISEETLLDMLKLELGDVLSYTLRLIDECGWTLEEVFQANKDKIDKRNKDI